MSLTRITTAIVALFAVFAVSAQASAKDQIYTGRFNNDAVSGYDAVAYFKQGQPVKGSNEFTYEYNGATWKFSSAENLADFKANPAAFAPQFGGYCAYAVSQGYTASGNPKNWTIVDNKLYLNYNTSIQKKWQKDIPGYIALATKEWPGVLN